MSRLRSSAMIVGAIVLLEACALLFDFSEFDTTRDIASVNGDGAQQTDGTAADGPTTPALRFELDVPASISALPGAPLTLPIKIRRLDGFDRSVIISLEPSPAGFVPITATTIEPSASAIDLTLTQVGDTPDSQTIKIVATSEALREEATLEIAVRGPPCTLDNQFGPQHNGLVEITSEAAQGDFLDPIAVASRGDFIVTLSTDENGLAFVHRMTAQGLATADIVGPIMFSGPRGLAIDDTTTPSTLLVLFPNKVERRALNGTLDPSYGGKNLPLNAYAFAPADSGVSVFGLSADSKRWRIFGLTPTGSPSSFGDGGLAETDLGAPAENKAALQLATMNTACGETGVGASARPGFARFTNTGAIDPTFGGGGQVIHSNFSHLTSCAARDGGLAATITEEDGGGSLLVLRDDGTRSPEFGDGGVVRVPWAQSRQVATDASGRILVLDRLGNLFRLLPDGTLDETLGPGGKCALAEIKPAIFTFQKNRLVVLTRASRPIGSPDPLTSRVGRIWL